MIRVLIADDQAMVRGALAALLMLEGDIDVLGQVSNGQEALEFVAHAQDSGTPIDVALLDVEMPVLDGLRTCEQLRQSHPQVKVLMVTTFGRPGYVARALNAGAQGFLVKDAPAQQLADAIRTASQGGRVIDPALAVESLSIGLSPLTARETEVLQAVASGGTVETIAQKVHLSTGTVRNHISTILAKTGTQSRSEAVRVATENGWL